MRLRLCWMEAGAVGRATAAAELATVRRCPVRPACAWTDFVKAAACLSSDMAAEWGEEEGGGRGRVENWRGRRSVRVVVVVVVVRESFHAKQQSCSNDRQGQVKFNEASNGKVDNSPPQNTRLMQFYVGGRGGREGRGNNSSRVEMLVDQNP